MKYISLGINCFSSHMLKVYGLRNESLMFDWASVTIDKLIKILNKYSIDNYKDLFINDTGRWIYGNRYPKERNKLITWLHHSDQKYRERVTERFFNRIANNEEKCFIITRDNAKRRAPFTRNGWGDRNDILCLINILKKITSNFKVILIDVIHTNNNSLENILDHKHLDYYDYYILETSYSTPFSVDLSRYKIFESLIKKYEPNLDINKIFSEDNLKKIKEETIDP